MDRDINGKVLNLRVGDLVEVRSIDEILASLDDQGRLDHLPFMPEMLQYCGKRFRVFKSAHKTCDTIEKPRNREMTDAVHLEGLRCDGKAHGECQAACLLFWKTAWLKSVHNGNEKSVSNEPPLQGSLVGTNGVYGCDLETLNRSTKVVDFEGRSVQDTYRCQTTELLRATRPLKWWDLRQYVKDLSSRNVRLDNFVYYVMIAAFNFIMHFPSDLDAFASAVLTFVTNPPPQGYHDDQANLLWVVTLPWVRNPCQCVKIVLIKYKLSRQFVRYLMALILTATRPLIPRMRPYPHIKGMATGKTPAEALNLQPGELVEIRSKAEIMLTIDSKRRNRGLPFPREVLSYCGQTFRVLHRVERIINEKTGKLMQLPNVCLILAGVTCNGCLSRNRLFCPRSIYPFWHEVWLKRVNVLRNNVKSVTIEQGSKHSIQDCHHAPQPQQACSIGMAPNRD